MPINFPNTGLVANVTTYTYDTSTWLWNGVAWDNISAPVAYNSQKRTLIATRETTTGAANQALLIDGASALVIPARSAWNFNVQLSAYNDTDNAVAGYSFRGVLRRNASNGTALVGSPISESWKETAMDGVSASVVADDANEALEIRVTGLAGKSILWVAVVEISQATYT